MSQFKPLQCRKIGAAHISGTKLSTGKKNCLWVIEPAKIQTDLLSAKDLFKSTEQKVVPVRALNLSAHDKVISKNSELGQFAPIDAE